MPRNDRLQKKRKKRLHADRQRLHRSGGRGTDADKALTRQYHILMKQHNRLRRAIEKQERNNLKSHQQRQFKADPMKFGQQLFEKKSCGDPSFSGEEAFAYFSNLYRDEKRAEEVRPMPEMKAPDMPKFLLSEDCPSSHEIATVVHKKSNGAAPGLDAVSYLPYKKCSSILPVLEKLFKKIWVTQDIPPAHPVAREVDKDL